MRLGLFGKLLVAFWLTMVVMSLGLGLLYGFNRTPESRVMVRAGKPVVQLLAKQIESAGVPAAEQARLQLPPLFLERLRIVAASQFVGGEQTEVVAAAAAPDGQRYVVVFDAHTSYDATVFDLPAPVLIAWGAAGLLFSALLAWYLSRPLHALRAGFRRMAAGDLQVRLHDRIGGRKDEIGDLARDFDLMAVRLDELVAARDRLLHDVSHELRSPLTRMQLAIGLARQNPERSDDSLERIEQEARKLDMMVHELLTLARAESGIAESEDYFDPVAVIEAVIIDARFEAEMTGGTIMLAVPAMDQERRPSVRGSAELFRRAIENVVRNALRFSPAEHPVRVAVELLLSPPRYRIAIVDEGPGVAHEVLGTLFDPFVRADPGGIGLGLAIAKRAIIAHGGSVVAHNREGGGFSVMIEVQATPHDLA